MSRISVTDTKRSFSELLNRAAFGDERIVVTSHGKPKAAILSIEHLEDVAAAAEADREFETGETLDWQTTKDDL